MVLAYVLILFGFLLGIVVVVAAQALGFCLILKRLRLRINKDQAKISSKTQLGSAQIEPQIKKEGVVWVLEPDKVSKLLAEKHSKEQKRKKDIFEVSPVRKYGKINGHSLVLTELDGLSTTVQLKGCVIEAVSSTSLSSKKWAKKYPIKMESKTSVIYRGSKTLYIYLDSSWEKEAWCNTLRLASCDQKEKLEWFAHLQEEFHHYLTSLNTEYHSFMKPSVGSSAEAIERGGKPDASSSKVRQFLKKLTKKPSRVGLDNKPAWGSFSFREERKSIEKFRACQDAVLATSFMKSASSNHMKSATPDNASPLPSTLSHSRSQSQVSIGSDVDTDEKFGIDEGTLCWNLLICRLFFDVRGNMQVKKSVQERIQRTLSNMRTPSYVGEVICTDINLGNVPPYIIGMRLLPMEMSDVCALEVDIEYSGSALIEIETRLEVGELELEKGTGASNPESSNDGAVASNILEGFEYLGEQLNLAEGMNDVQEPKGDVSKSFKHSTSSSTYASRWKSMLNSVAKQVSQVPLSLAIRVSSLRGTLRLQIRPPPTDQLWFGFTFMPDVDFNLESSIGEHRITNSHLALFLVNRLKAAIRETLVLPNCENICVPWMLAEKEDWVPRNVAPFIWIHQDSGNETSTTTDTDNQPSVGLKASAGTLNDDPELEQHNKLKRTEYSLEPARKSDSLAIPLTTSKSFTLRNSKSLEELTTPLLVNDKTQETGYLKELGTPSSLNDNTDEAREDKMGYISVSESPCRSIVIGKQCGSIELDNSKPRKIGRKEKMLDLKKRMSEKFEEKKRHIEEKSRHIVEKMRGPP
ncbi:hypothetical protein RJT34_26118 [Clitoria ternatea]|uniref:SMP-LTD domain-containing protein n=1 Tax=Clitoria ternatea TaxID=43366 RepID=A0AAN9FBG8_CLITE